MPEGDTVFRSARALNAALAGEVATGCDLRFPAVATVDLTGETIHEVISRGKHLLMRVGSATIHSHLKMEGSWHLYRPEAKWRRPAFQARAVLHTARWSAVGFELGTLDVVPTQQEDAILGYLGPDLLGPDWDAEVAVERLTANPDRPLAAALLDQRNLAGIGNVYANELCFLRGLLPDRPVSEVASLDAVVTLARRLMVANRDRPYRVFTGNTRPGQRTWVYGRAGQECLRCGTRILSGRLGRNALELRDTYWCPHCQR